MKRYRFLISTSFCCFVSSGTVGGGVFWLLTRSLGFIFGLLIGGSASGGSISVLFLVHDGFELIAVSVLVADVELLSGFNSQY